VEIFLPSSHTYHQRDRAQGLKTWAMIGGESLVARRSERSIDKESRHVWTSGIEDTETSRGRDRG